MVVVAGALCALFVLSACGASEPSPTPRPACPSEPPTQADVRDLNGALRARVAVRSPAVTGQFAIELRPDVAPLATANFVALARCGFYDGIGFHRILAGFVAQAGDPNTDADREGSDPTRIGSGGPPYRFEVELPPRELTYEQYSVSMARTAEPNSNGSQFFVALDDLTDVLQRDYTIFGRVVEGSDVIDAIGRVPVDGPAGHPLEPVTIESVTIEAAPAPSPGAS